MMVRLLTYIFALMLTAPAFAADASDCCTYIVPPSKQGKAASAADKVTVDPKLCQALVKHTPDANVAYQPGVDVHGNKVAPADLPGGSTIQLPDKINIPLTISLAKSLNLDTSQAPYSMLGQGTEATLGTISVQGEKVFFNGKPLSDEQQDNLAVLCMKPNGK